MNRISTSCLAAALFAVIAPGAFAAEPDYRQDAVGESFTRMLQHEAYSGPTLVAAGTRAEDPVELHVHAVLQSDETSVHGISDPYAASILASFQRMLNHEPYRGESAVTVARGVKDPVESAVHEMMWRDQEQTKMLLAKRQAAAENEG